MIDAYASLSHYYDHLRPVWEALPEGIRGTLYLGPRIAVPGVPRSPRGNGPVTLVASWADLDRIRPRRVILMEHGAGQSYSDRHPAYAGGLERETVDLFLCPGPHSVMRNARFYPDKPVVQIGSPVLDRWLNPPKVVDGNESTNASLSVPEINQCIAVTWHWNNPLHPETRWAWPTFHRALPELSRRFSVLGHAHSRARPAIERQYRRLGIRWTEWAEVMEAASVLVVDNSSAGFEFAATGRPVVWMNAPGYRVGVEHGIRFWANAGVGYACSEPERLVGVVEKALSEDVSAIERRLSFTPYSHLDGRSAERASEAIVSILGESEAA